MGILLQAFPAEGGQMHEGHVQCDQCQALGPIYREKLDATIGSTAAYIATCAAGKARKQGWETAGHYPDIMCQCPRCGLLDPDWIGDMATADDQAFAATLVPTAPADPAPARRRRRGIGVREDKPAPPVMRCADTQELAGMDYSPDIVYQIPIGLLAPDSDGQARIEFKPAELAALAADLVASGQQSPIKFRVGTRDEDGTSVPQLYIVHGERRWRAAHVAGLDTIAGILDSADPDAELLSERLLRQATDNDLHEPLTAWDWACTIKRLTEPPHKMKVGEISKELTKRGITGKSHSVVSTFLSLHRLPAWGQEAIQRGTLTRSHAKYIIPHLDRAEIMDALGGWLAKRVAKIVPDRSAIEDDESAVDGSDPPPNPTINMATEAAYDARPVSIPELRTAIADIYEQRYMPLQNGKWPMGEPRVYMQAQFDWAVECVRCSNYATADGRSGPRSYCCDITLDCFNSKNMALARARDARSAAPSGTVAGTPQAAQPADRKADFEARQAQAQAECDAIRAAVSTADPEQLLALLLWRLIGYHAGGQGRDAAIPTPAAIARHLSDHTRTRFLRARLAGLLDLNYHAPQRAVIREYLGLQIESEE